ncbi:CHAP domain-containing protein [bacterium]|nr:MAG: CHAP domain-containing protein [bacterium]
MLPLIAKGAVSFKREILMVLASMAVIVALPVFALASALDKTQLATPELKLYDGPLSITAGYDFGYCTYWAALRREQSGHPIPVTWGNANTWAIRALGDGYSVGHRPVMGAVMQTTAGALGHVAYVESVAADGSWTISEMNFKGWDEVDTRTLSAKAALEYSFIY